MATNLVFSGGGDLTLYETPNTLADGDKIMWKSYAPARMSGWRKISYAGYNGLDAQFFGRKPRIFSVVGYISAATIALAETLSNKVLALNDNKKFYTLTGPINTVDAEKAVIEDIVFNPIGLTGPTTEFIMLLVMIGEVS